MKHHHTKRVIAGLLTAAMILPSPVSLLSPMTASAGEILYENEFDRKILPWHTVEQSPAKQTINIRDGAAHISILHPTGQDKSQYDLQFRYDNLQFTAGHEYKVSFKVKAKRTGMELASHFCNPADSERYFVLDAGTGDMHMGPDMGGNWGRVVTLTTEYQEFSGTFIPTRDIQNAQWRFQYADDANGWGGNAQAGDELWFDDLTIRDMTDDSCPGFPDYGYVSKEHSGRQITVNQIGYFQGLEKHATLGDNAGDFGLDYSQGEAKLTLSGTYDYEIVRTSDDKVVYTGETGPVAYDRDSGDNVCKIDFTAFDTPGEYYIRIKGKEWKSFPFKIGTGLYQEEGHNLLTNALNMFYQNRSGCKIESQYITSGDQSMLAHNYNYREKVGYILPEWNMSENVEFEGEDIKGCEKVDIGSGWFTSDTSDKDMTEAGSSIWTLQNMYERAMKTEEGRQKFADGSGTLVIPEAGNGIPDILDECRVALDQMAKMKVQTTEKEWGEYAGLYHHMLKAIGFNAYNAHYIYDSAVTESPAAYKNAYTVQPPTFAATLNYAACAAQGARLWAQYDADYAAELFQNAKDAYQAYRQHWYAAAPNEATSNSKSLYAPFMSGTSDYDVSDEAYWAASELYITAMTLEDANADMYYQHLSNYDKAFSFQSRVYGGDSAIEGGSFTMFTDTNTAAAGSMSLLLNETLLNTEPRKALVDSLMETADAFIQVEEKQGYGIPYLYDGPGMGDPYGIDMTFFIQGYEFNSNGRVLNNMMAMAYVYDLTQDTKYLNGIVKGMDYLLGNNPLSFSYITGYGDYCAKNPSHRFWIHSADASFPSAPDGVIVSGPNAKLEDPYVQLSGLTPGEEDNYSQRCYIDSVESWSTNRAMLSNNAALAWITSFMQDETALSIESEPGDVNADGQKDIEDEKALLNFLLGEGTVKAPASADLNKDGKLNAADLTLLKRLLRK